MVRFLLVAASLLSLLADGISTAVAQPVPSSGSCEATGPNHATATLAKGSGSSLFVGGDQVLVLRTGVVDGVEDSCDITNVDATSITVTSADLSDEVFVLDNTGPGGPFSPGKTISVDLGTGDNVLRVEMTNDDDTVVANSIPLSPDESLVQLDMQAGVSGGLSNHVDWTNSLDLMSVHLLGGADRFAIGDPDSFVNIAVGGGAGNDQLTASSASFERLWGGRGNDLLTGGSGIDFLYGGPGKDTCKGGPGNDSLYGGPGKDTCKGGPGRDHEGRCER